MRANLKMNKKLRKVTMMKKMSLILITRKNLLSVVLREFKLKAMMMSSSWMMKETFMICKATSLVILTWTMKMKKVLNNNTKMTCVSMSNDFNYL